MTSSVASKFNSAGHLQFFTCPPTAVSIGNTNPEIKWFQWVIFQLFEVGLRDISVHFLCHVPSSVLLIGTALWGVLAHTQVSSPVFMALLWVISSHSHSQAATRTEPQPGEANTWAAGREWQKEGKHVLYQNQPSGPTACPVEVGCKWNSTWPPGSLINYRGVQVPLGIPSLDSQPQHNPQHWEKPGLNFLVQRVWLPSQGLWLHIG